MYDILLTQIMNIFIEHWYINFSNYIYLFYDNNDKQFNDIKFITITYLLWYLNVRDTYIKAWNLWEKILHTQFPLTN